MMNKVYSLFVVGVWSRQFCNLGRQNSLSACLGSLMPKTEEWPVQKPSQILRSLQI